MVPIVGAEGAPGTELITTLPVDGETHPASLVTVKVNVPDARPLTVALVPVPELDPPGFLAKVQGSGRLLNTTLPDDAAQVGWVMVPTVGTDGVADEATLSVLAALVPHVLDALTEIVPPAAPAVANMDVEVELPLHPPGNVHE